MNEARKEQAAIRRRIRQGESPTQEEISVLVDQHMVDSFEAAKKPRKKKLAPKR